MKIDYKKRYEEFDSNFDLQNRIKNSIDILKKDHCIHENTYNFGHHIFKIDGRYLKDKLIVYGYQVEDEEDLYVGALYDDREGNFWYLVDTRYLDPNEYHSFIKKYLDKKNSDET